MNSLCAALLGAGFATLVSGLTFCNRNLLLASVAFAVSAVLVAVGVVK